MLQADLGVCPKIHDDDMRSQYAEAKESSRKVAAEDEFLRFGFLKKFNFFQFTVQLFVGTVRRHFRIAFADCDFLFCGTGVPTLLFLIFEGTRTTDYVFLYIFLCRCFF